MTLPRGRKCVDAEALSYHSLVRPGKLAIVASKPLVTQHDLSLAYSPGVAAPVHAIAQRPLAVYEYTAKGNLIAIISNGSAILGLGNLGALACKPVMEGKAVLFKRFADVDAIDIELSSEDPAALIEAIAMMEPGFGGINLEDIKAPECFEIERALCERMKIPVMHDDQHGTAIIVAAALINTCLLTGKDLAALRVVINGAGAAALATAQLLREVGVRRENVLVCDLDGVLFAGRGDISDPWKKAHATETQCRTLRDALRASDVFIGLSAGGALKGEWVRDMAQNPVICALANPVPEIWPETVFEVRPDAIIATGRSDYPNQVNNVLGFPFIFRGALDVRATAINSEMKIAAAKAIAELAREEVPEEVSKAYGRHQQFGRDYIIPAPFDPRLMEVVSAAVANAAMASGVAQVPVADFAAYRASLRARLSADTA